MFHGPRDLAYATRRATRSDAAHLVDLERQGEREAQLGVGR